jgi:class 3 adenylate cyclase
MGADGDMKLFQIKTLQQRMVLFLLLPVGLLLFGVGFSGFIFARDTMLSAWNEAAILKLERAAHHIDMRMGRPMDWIEMFHETGGMAEGYADPQWVLEQIRGLPGVARVDLRWTQPQQQPMHMRGRGFGMGRGYMMRFHRANISEVTPPHLDTQTGQETVSLISRLKDESGGEVGSLEVALRFDYLIQDIRRLGWWQSHVGYLVDDAGRFIAHTRAVSADRKRLGETADPLELAVLEAIQKQPYGTLRGPGHPPGQVGGFYRLSRAPWTMLLVAQGQEILSPIIRFRKYYFLSGGLCILVILLLIRVVLGRQVRSITRISEAAASVAEGDYGAPLPVVSHDEIGRLTRGFNTMVQGLKERDFISNTFGRYVDEEIARELMQKPEAARLGGRKREVVILMSDLRNFTPLSETLSPEETIRVLNHYFSHMIEIIRKHRGIIVDFFGDALLVFFDPLDKPIEPIAGEALRCAFEMQEEIARFNEESRKAGQPRLDMGIGVHSGEVVVGNIGSDTRAKYGIVGAPVNVTQRIQALAERGQVVVSDSVHRYARDALSTRRSFTVDLRGVTEPVRLHLIEPPLVT